MSGEASTGEDEESASAAARRSEVVVTMVGGKRQGGTIVKIARAARRRKGERKKGKLEWSQRLLGCWKDDRRFFQACERGERAARYSKVLGGGGCLGVLEPFWTSNWGDV